jgi:type I restriction enzyme S subunit
MAEIPFDIPPLKEQQKIAKILTTWDNAISKQEELIKEKEKLKKGLMQKLLSGEVRFDGFSEEWEEFRFSKFLTEVSKKSKIENEYKILSSTIKDIELRDGRVDAKTNIGYKILNKNQLVLSPQNLWLGNINFNIKFDIGLVSPSYKIFNINTNILSVDFAKYIFKTNKMLFEYKTCSEIGASVVRRNLDLDSFYLIPIKLPSLQEQQKIAQVLSQADKEIELLKNELESLKEQKKGLMQRLLTGEVMVKA